MTLFGWNNRAEFGEHVTRRLSTRSFYAPLVVKETMKNETHAITTEFPLVNGQTQTTDCGLTVERAEIEQVWDDMATGTKLTLPRSTGLLCDECWSGVFSYKDSTPRKIYAVRERRKQITEGDAE